MAQFPQYHRPAAPRAEPPPLLPAAPPPGWLATLAERLAAWRRRSRRLRGFRGFDRRQLRDLGIEPFDQW
jgi:uncharacterized protein YjiS (DUF1127 family)